MVKKNFTELKKEQSQSKKSDDAKDDAKVWQIFQAISFKRYLLTIVLISYDTTLDAIILSNYDIT